MSYVDFIRQNDPWSSLLDRGAQNDRRAHFACDKVSVDWHEFWILVRCHWVRFCQMITAGDLDPPFDGLLRMWRLKPPSLCVFYEMFSGLSGRTLSDDTPWVERVMLRVYDRELVGVFLRFLQSHLQQIHKSLDLANWDLYWAVHICFNGVNYVPLSLTIVEQISWWNAHKSS